MSTTRRPGQPGQTEPLPGQDGPARPLPPAAQRALAEAEARRRDEARLAAERPQAPPELHGRGGLDPARYNDWEIDGRAVDF